MDVLARLVNRVRSNSVEAAAAAAAVLEDVLNLKRQSAACDISCQQPRGFFFSVPVRPHTEASK